MGTQMPIEAALHWAYAIEMPKVNGPELPSIPNGWTLIERSGQGLYSGGSVWWTSLEPPSAGPPHRDAIRLHQAVVALNGIDRIEYNPDSGLEAGIASFALDAGKALADAFGKVAIEVIRHAKHRRAPDVDISWPRPQAIHYQNGVPKVMKPALVRQRGNKRNIVYDTELPSYPTRRGAYDPGSFCPLRWLPNPATLLRERAEYAAWWAALDHLAATTELETIELTPPTAPQVPWIGDSDSNMVNGRIVRSIVSDQKLAAENVQKAAEYLHIRGVARI